MTRSAALLVVGLVVGGPVAQAQVVDRGPSVWSREAMATALRDTVIPVTPQALQADWAVLTQYVRQEIVVRVDGIAARRYALIAVEGTALTVVDPDRPGVTLAIPRATVVEVSQRSGRRGSKVGAVVGAAAGLGIGMVSYLMLSLKQCGASCSDEGLLRGAAIVGFPIAGGMLGSRLGARDTFTILYRRP